MFKGPRDLSSREGYGDKNRSLTPARSIGWLNAADQWHDWSVAVLSARRGPLHTTEIVLGEACWQLAATPSRLMRCSIWCRKGALVLARPWPEHLAGTQQIMLKYPSMDAADASLVARRISPKAALVTTDRRDFQPCRGLRNRALKLIGPKSPGPRGGSFSLTRDGTLNQQSAISNQQSAISNQQSATRQSPIPSRLTRPSLAAADTASHADRGPKIRGFERRRCG